MNAASTPLKAAFLESYYRFATPEDVPESELSKAELALSQLSWGMTRKPGEILVRAFNPTDSAYGAAAAHTVIETITDDSPFIIDSLTMQLNALSQGVLVKLHCVLSVERDRNGRLHGCESSRKENVSDEDRMGHQESWTHFEIPRVLDTRDIRAIEKRLRDTLLDVRTVVHSWPRMLNMLRRSADDLRTFGRGPDIVESARFLDWLADNHFTLLGYWAPPAGGGLGLLHDRKRRDGLRKSNAKRHSPELLTISKAPIHSTVHRPALLDDIRVTSFDSRGRVKGEHRFVGLFTSVAYNENPRDIPLLGTKVEHVIERSGLDPASHRGKALRHILDTFPRDALIQSSIGQLEEISIGILNIEERRKIRLFCMQSAYGDFLDCLVYLPRDGYSSRARTGIESLLAAVLGGVLVDSQLMISESTLARLSLTIQRHDRKQPIPDIGALQNRLTEVASAWIDRARFALLETYPEERALALHHRFAAAFPVAYQDTAENGRIGRDFTLVAEIADGARDSAFRLVAHDHQGVFSVFMAGDPVPLFLANPILEHMGIRLLQETSYGVEYASQTIWIQDFQIESADGETLTSSGLPERLEDCFAQTLRRRIENDGFNRLVLSAGLGWREAVVLRSYCKYLLQCRAQFSQSYMLDTLRRHPAFAHALAALFACYFDPVMADDARTDGIAAQTGIIRQELDRVRSLDDDRILRLFSCAVQATLRTNFYQRVTGEPKSWLSFKLDPSRIPELPEPRPKFEIFVYSPLVEGVHLRCSEIARGGIRWSDRREDFRTEVLGLMKAQQVKNTVIVPAGAKGGFVLKSPPTGDRAALQEHVVDCYRTFLRGLLDLTDNIVGTRTVAPRDTVCRDAPDPYLVVAADKGTATFSDTANAVAAEYGFWLGDAFASGGSAGYDHKKMGITARGAWESVRRHFRELDVDADRDPIRVVGIGDMSGDVFGNGMLLSGNLRLIAAFNHRHIFIDPDPDPATSFAERQRLFALPRSGWTDYDSKLISAGGGVYDRQAKSIRLSPQARATLGIEATELTPPELIRAVLRAPVDLLWNGGIGTYVKASTETSSDAADPTNDPVRVDGKALRARVVAEGGNLGLTQRGRVEYALAGGRINTDFIDNSGGVDSSDREVNIKILLADAIHRKALAPARRNALLKSMTDEIASLVLASNYAQTQALSMMTAQARERLGEHARLIRILEARGLLKRGLEYLPGEEEIDERRRQGLGFTRPELAVILSYAKIELCDSLIATSIPDEPHWQSEISAYFPERLRKRFEVSIRKHRLRREIAAMLISSSMINRMGPFFALRARDETGADVADIARAYSIVRSLFETRRLWREIEALDGQVQAAVQYDCFSQCSRMVRRAVYWFLHRRHRNRNIDVTVAELHNGVTAIVAALPSPLCGYSKRSFDHDLASFEALGLPRHLGERVASLRLMTQVLDITELAAGCDGEPVEIARLYFELGRGLRLDWIREQIEELRVEGHWRAMARGTLRETLANEQCELLRGILRRARGTEHRTALGDWLTAQNAGITRLKRTLDEMQSAGQMDFATLSIALKEIGRLR
jgi:glutamate dehydrogenase